MKITKSLTYLILISLAAIVGVSAPSHAQGIDGFRSIKFGMDRETLIQIVNERCVDALPTRDLGIEAFQCFVVDGENRDIEIHFNRNSKVSGIGVRLGGYFHAKFEQVDSVLASKYKRQFIEAGIIVYADGQVILQNVTLRHKPVIMVSYVDHQMAERILDNLGLRQRELNPSDF